MSQLEKPRSVHKRPPGPKDVAKLSYECQQCKLKMEVKVKYFVGWSFVPRALMCACAGIPVPMQFTYQNHEQRLIKVAGGMVPS